MKNYFSGGKNILVSFNIKRFRPLAEENDNFFKRKNQDARDSQSISEMSIQCEGYEVLHLFTFQSGPR